MAGDLFQRHDVHSTKRFPFSPDAQGCCLGFGALVDDVVAAVNVKRLAGDEARCVVR
jgi:hypothetical protein